MVNADESPFHLLGILLLLLLLIAIIGEEREREKKRNQMMEQGTICLLLKWCRLSAEMMIASVHARSMFFLPKFFSIILMLFSFLNWWHFPPFPNIKIFNCIQIHTSAKDGASAQPFSSIHFYYISYILFFLFPFRFFFVCSH